VFVVVVEMKYFPSLWKLLKFNRCKFRSIERAEKYR